MHVHETGHTSVIACTCTFFLPRAHCLPMSRRRPSGHASTAIKAPIENQLVDVEDADFFQSPASGGAAKAAGSRLSPGRPKGEPPLEEVIKYQVGLFAWLRIQISSAYMPALVGKPVPVGGLMLPARLVSAS